MKKKTLSSEYPFAIGIPAVIWQILFFYAPLLLLLVGSFLTWSDTNTFTGVSLDKFTFFFRGSYLSVIASSLLLALSNSIICFLIAYPLAYFMAFKGRKWQNLLLFFLIVPFWTNFLLHVYAWFFVLEREGFLNTLLQWLGITSEPIIFLNSTFATMVMMVYYYMPFILLPMYSSLEKFDVKLIEASYDLGASWLQTLRKIVLPLCSRGIKTGFFLVFIPSFGEFAIPELMGGDRRMFVGTVVSQFILGDETGSFGAAFTVFSCVVLLISSLALYFFIDWLLKPKATRW
ncbi:MAG: ABC transporter permease [Simkania sp.]|nr:ABC transporter permease [Simkania sp.]